MRYIFGVVIVVLALVFAAGIPAATDAPPAWAYGTPPTPPPPAQPAKDDGSLKHLSGSTAQFTLTQIRDAFGPADWYPGDHPTMPDVVAHGRKPDVRACSLCHYPNGKGRPENAPVAGYPTSYFIQQMMDFKNGLRKSSDPTKANTNLMIGFAKSMTDDEIRQAAEYFGSMKWTPWIKVVETKMVPKTRLAGGMYLTLEGNEKEPLGGRIIETPDNTEATEMLRDDHSGFTAYVPPGSIKKGEALVTTGGGGKTTKCGACHGADLRGIGPVPGIAGRSPSYLVRQMYDMQHGTRNGTWTQLMKPVVAKLSDAEMLEIAAYTASRMP
jgi:cytochrome c553